MKFCRIIMLFLFPVSVIAADPAFDDINDSDMTEITKGMGANFLHNSIMGASEMGTLFGFQLGLVAAQTSVPKINDIAKENAGAELPNLYNAGLMGAIGVPFGISVEGVFVPSTKIDGLKLQTTSLALKWNINDVVPVLPINVALRGFYSLAEFSFEQTTPVNTTVKNDTKVSGIQLLISPMFPLIEPYAGIGIVNADNELTGTGIFDAGYTVGTSASKKESGTQILVGVNANLVLFKLGAEYSRAFSNDRIGVKIAFGF